MIVHFLVLVEVRGLIKHPFNRVGEIGFVENAKLSQTLIPAHTPPNIKADTSRSSPCLVSGRNVR